MKLSRFRIGAVLAGVLLAVPVPLAQAAPVYTPPTPVVSVYNTPGTQFVGGRAWRTACQQYSSGVVVCRTEIWATQVVRAGSHYRQVTGWAFNNLTYLSSPRSAWVNNNLGRTAAWTNPDGRRWRTECDTALTGRGGCRSFIEARVVVRVGGSFRTETRWVYNNQVLFSSASIPPVTSVPKSVLQRAVLTPTGFGPLQVGLDTAAMHGAYLARTDPYCGRYQASAEVQALGVDLAEFHEGEIVYLATASGSTPIGDKAGVSTFRIGMTFAQLKEAFPGKIALVNRKMEGGVFQAASLREGEHELLFYKDWNQGDRMNLLPGEVIVTARARVASYDHSYRC